MQYAGTDKMEYSLASHDTPAYLYPDSYFLIRNLQLTHGHRRLLTKKIGRTVHFNIIKRNVDVFYSLYTGK